MKLSEAIRIGAAKRPQAHGDYIQLLENGTICTDALGAAYEAITGQVPPSIYDQGGEGVVDNAIVNATGAGRDLRQRIARWNDDGLTREELAAWLEEQGL